MSIFYCKSIIIEEAPAWEECKHCKGEDMLLWSDLDGGDNMYAPCTKCLGKGDNWHKAVWEVKQYDSNAAYFTTFGRLIKSSTLIREHEVCKECRGEKKAQADDVFGKWQKGDPCPHCLRDADGKPTGVEPGTAGEWRIKP